MRIRRKLRSVIHRIWPPKPRPLILMYHRIAEDPIDHWGLSVSPAHFQEQLDVLRRTRRPFSLTEFVRRLAAGTLPSNAVAVTFDDGYADNLISGKPRLAAAGVPATVFLATGHLDRPDEFWWDELARLVLAGDGPGNFELVVGRTALHVDRGAGAVARKHGTLSAAMPKRRQAALAPIWEAMRRVNEDERQKAMADIRSVITDRSHNVDRGRTMTRDEVRTLVSDGLVTIGAHTVTHPMLTTLGSEACLNEMAQSRAACEALVGAEVTGFAYPYGAFDDKVREAVKAAGFDVACSTREMPATSSSDFLALPRIQICNWNGDAFQRALYR
jgi:peptidoglycan/xylan/chitin deacetylase (PgdA/CDA1 family)